MYKFNMSNSLQRSSISMANKYDRVVLLIDMDCFYCQVEEKLNPSLKGQPIAVVQYNEWRGGGIIAVNYPARAKGVSRHMRGDEAKTQCPDIQLVKVPNLREKADLSKYRDAGKEVANVLQNYTSLLERASVDEAYLDITESVNKRLEQVNQGSYIIEPEKLISTYAIGFVNIGDYITAITSKYSHSLNDRHVHEADDELAVRTSDIRLLIGASIANEIRLAVKAETGYECSAGIAHNKILAKLACGINKPNKQTILPLQSISQMFETLPLSKIKGLGGKFGEEICQRLNIRYLGQLTNYSEIELRKVFDEKNAIWLYNISRGIDLEAVTPRFYSKSIGCCKKFPGRNNITGMKTLQHWLNELANEINDRLEKDIIENNRRAKQMVVSFIQDFDGQEISSSRSAPLNTYDSQQLATASLEIIKANTKQFFRPGSDCVLNNPIRFLGISVGRFETVSSAQNKLQQMFANQVAKKKTSIYDDDNDNHHADGDGDDDGDKESEVKIVDCNQQTTTVNPCHNTLVAPTIASDMMNSQIDNPGISDDLNSLICDMKKIEKVENHSSSKVPEIINNKTVMPSSSTPASHGAIKRKLSEVANGPPPTIEQQDYRSTYAEYAIPVLNLNSLDIIKCPKCGKVLLNDEVVIQTHRDYHFAQELSKEQRREFREERKIQAPTSKAPVHQQSSAASSKANRKQKRSQTQTHNVNKKTSSTSTATITKFLKQANATSSLATSLNNVNLTTPANPSNPSNDDIIICDICKLPIQINQLTEHKDYHIAKDMQKQFYQLEAQKMMSTKKTIPSPKRKTAIKTITQFFTNAKS